MEVRERFARVLLAVSMLIMGACGLVYEYVLSVLGNYLIGSSHEEIFIIIGLMMFAMGLGSFLQRHLAGELVDLFLGVELLLGVVGGFSATLVYATFSVSESYRIVLYGVALLVGVLIGMEIPILIRLNERYSKSLQINLSEILSMDYVGALLGAVLFTYVLLSHVPLTEIAFLLGLTNVVIAAFGIWGLYPLIRRKRSLLVACVLSSVALLYGWSQAADWAALAEQRYFLDPVVHRSTSKYQHIVVTARGERVRLYLNGHLQFSSTDEEVYHEMLVHPAMSLAPQRRRILILGGGDGLALREVLTYPEVDSVTLVDLDPAIVELARTHELLRRQNHNAFERATVSTHLGVGVGRGPLEVVEIADQRPTRRFETPRQGIAEVHVMTIDADLFLRQASRSGGQLYDVILIDFPDPKSIELAKLYSREFYRNVLQLLAPRGHIAVQSTSPFHAPAVFLCIGQTLRAAGFSALPYHQNVPSFGEWGFHVAVAGAGQEQSLHERMARCTLSVPTDYVTESVIAGSLHFGKNALDTSEDRLGVRLEVNTQLNPTIVEYHRLSWRNY